MRLTTQEERREALEAFETARRELLKAVERSLQDESQNPAAPKRLVCGRGNGNGAATDQ